ATLRLLLDQTAVGMAGPNTAIGDAIGLGIRMLDRAGERDKVLILLTDGNDTGSAVPPPRAAALAAQHDVTVHTIGIGDPEAGGEHRVDYDAWREIARTAGGQFFLAQDGAALQDVYATLDRITPRDVKTLRHQPKRDYFWVPLGLALCLLGLWHGAAALATWRSGRLADSGKAQGAKEGAWTAAWALCFACGPGGWRCCRGPDGSGGCGVANATQYGATAGSRRPCCRTWSCGRRAAAARARWICSRWPWPRARSPPPGRPGSATSRPSWITPRR